MLAALNGAPHLIRELQATRGLLVGERNPINKLVEDFNAAIDAHPNGFLVVPVDLPPEILAKVAIEGLPDTGNPKHVWDYLLKELRAASNDSSTRAG